MVNAAGTLVRGSSGVSVSGSGGNYVVTFPVSVNTCAFVGNVASTIAETTTSDLRIGFAEPVLVTGQPTQVRVFTYDKGSSPSARDFTLTVLC